MKYQSFRRLGLGLAMGILCACIACFAMLENPAFEAKADGGETTDQGQEWFVRFTWNGPVASA